MRRFLLFCASLFLVIFTGCILPIPHTRITKVGCSGIIEDEYTLKAVTNACVTVEYTSKKVVTRTEADGKYCVPDEKRWHGALVIGPFCHYSLFPSFKTPIFPYRITVQANGYETWTWQMEIWIEPEKDEEIDVKNLSFQKFIYIKLRPLEKTSDTKTYGERK